MSPLSNDPDRRAAQLSNLRAGSGQAGAGNQRALAHGGYAQVAHERLDAKVAEVFDALAQDAPLRDSDGGLPASDSAAVHLAAEAMCRIDDVSAHLRDRGILDAKGELRAAVDVERRLRLEAADHLASLGLSPRSRAALGLDLVRSFDLATHWAQADDNVDADAVSGSSRPASDDRDGGGGGRGRWLTWSYCATTYAGAAAHLLAVPASWVLAQARADRIPAPSNAERRRRDPAEP